MCLWLYTSAVHNTAQNSSDHHQSYQRRDAGMPKVLEASAGSLIDVIHLANVLCAAIFARPRSRIEHSFDSPISPLWSDRIGSGQHRAQFSHWLGGSVSFEALIAVDEVIHQCNRGGRKRIKKRSSSNETVTDYTDLAAYSKCFHTTMPVLNNTILLRCSARMLARLQRNCVSLRRSPHPYCWS